MRIAVYDYLGKQNAGIKHQPPDIITCPKCHKTSGDSWSQCGSWCPMEMSPYYRNPDVEYAEYERFEPISDCAEYVPRVEEEYEEDFSHIRVRRY